MKEYPEYKESSIEWLDKIPSSWNEIAIKHLASLKSGENITSQEIDQDGQYRVYGGNGIRGFYSEYTHDGDFVLIGRQGALCGNINYAKGKFWATEHAVVATPKREYKLVWFGELLRTMNLNQYSMSAAQPGLSVERIENLKIPVPSLPEQQAIADFLDCKTSQIDTLIEKKQRQIDLLQEQRTALINHAVTKGLNPNALMKDSGVEWLGEIPRHWEVKKIAYFVDKITNGYVGPTRDILRDDGVRYIQSLHIKKNTIDFHKPYYVSQEWSKEHARTILRENDVLVVQTGAIGEVGIVPKEFGGANCHALIILRAKEQLGHGKFLLYALTSEYGRHSMLSIMTGALHPHLNTTYLRDVYLAIPPKDEQNEIIKYIENKTKEIDLLNEKYVDTISFLQEYRTALISEAVTGKIDVR